MENVIKNLYNGNRVTVNGLQEVADLLNKYNDVHGPLSAHKTAQIRNLIEIRK